jgi:hypothetical protein
MMGFRPFRNGDGPFVRVTGRGMTGHEVRAHAQEIHDERYGPNEPDATQKHHARSAIASALSELQAIEREHLDDVLAARPDLENRPIIDRNCTSPHVERLSQVLHWFMEPHHDLVGNGENRIGQLNPGGHYPTDFVYAPRVENGAKANPFIVEVSANAPSNAMFKSKLWNVSRARANGPLLHTREDLKAPEKLAFYWGAKSLDEVLEAVNTAAHQESMQLRENKKTKGNGGKIDGSLVDRKSLFDFLRNPKKLGKRGLDVHVLYHDVEKGGVLRAIRVGDLFERFGKLDKKDAIRAMRDIYGNERALQARHSF